MTDISDIKVGDRVRATSKTNDDTAEFTVVYAYTWGVDTAANSYDGEDFDFEVIKPAPNPVPTEPGLYSFYKDDTPITQSRRLLLTKHGEWYFLDFTAGSRDGILEPVPNISKIVNSPAFPGANYDITLVYNGKTN
ncbi:MAG TPA: hypothetical protein VJR06_04950 [Nitrososphaerales archaeon]|nr:hypothetical protein [Nitrososphaerales archaeon]